jgi:hypothetical protein
MARTSARDGADRGAGVLDGPARRRIALARPLDAVSRHHPHLLEAEVEFLGGDLGERGQDALAELDLAGGDAHGAVVLEAQPAVEARIVPEALANAHRRPPRASPRLPGPPPAGCAGARRSGRGSVERLDDLGAAGRRVAVEQRLGRHQHARQAVAALSGLFVDERLLQRMQRAGVRRAPPR